MQQTYKTEFLLVRVMRSFITNVQELPVPKAGHASSLSEWLHDRKIHEYLSFWDSHTFIWAVKRMDSKECAHF